MSKGSAQSKVAVSSCDCPMPQRMVSTGVPAPDISWLVYPCWASIAKCSMQLLFGNLANTL